MLATLADKTTRPEKVRGATTDGDGAIEPGRGEAGGHSLGGRVGPRSVVLPYRGAGNEPQILLTFCETVMQSDVDELVIGVDRDVDEYPEIKKVYGLYGTRVRAVRVPASPDWGFRFAAVLWHLIEAAEHDLVLVTNVDELPSKQALGPPHKAGHIPGYVLESGPLERGGAPALPFWTGTFWVWRPALNDYFDLRLYKKIRDAGDIFFFWSAVGAGLRYHRRKAPWITISGKEHGDLGWVKWKGGFWESVHAQRAWGGIAVHRRAARNLVSVSGAVRQKRWWHVMGWLAGAMAPNSYWATQARTLHFIDWLYQGRLPYDDLLKWWWRRASSGEAVVVHGAVPA